MSSEKETDLYIPVNIRKRKEYFDGFGRTEMIQTIIGIAVGAVVGILIFLLKTHNIIVIVATIIGFGGATFMLVKKDHTNRSTIDGLKSMIDFNRSQKRYYYKYTNIYERELNNSGEKRVKKRDDGANSQ